MKPKPLPPLEVLRECFNFLPDGTLTLKKTRGSRGEQKHVGDVVGSPEKKGHLSVTLLGEDYKVHRLVFFYFHGWCPDIIDHKDGNPANNRLSNLRPATNSQNLANGAKRKYKRPLTSQYRGVSWDKVKRKWIASVFNEGRRIHLGRFATEQEALEARQKAARERYGDFAPTT